MNIQHSSRSDVWRTPAFVVEMIHKVLGTIDLDPASDIGANEVIKASQIITREEDGLSSGWTGKALFVNPPGGKIGNASKAGLFWAKLMSYREAGCLGHAIFMAFSAEALQTTQGKGCLSVGEFPLCVPRSRLKFVDPTNPKAGAPSHSNLIVYVPGRVDKSDLFEEVFKSLGIIINTRRHP
jgi:hypothetical protein